MDKKEHNGVAIIVARHDKPGSMDLSGYGAAYAFLLGKLLSDYEGISYPEHIFYSPVARARNTAKMHQLAMKINDIVPPAMSYDASFHEKASEAKVKESFADAIDYAEASDMKTIEIVGHEPTVCKIGKILTGKITDVDYGGALVIKADSWNDLRQGKCSVETINSSHDFALEALGEDQTELLDKLMCYGKKDNLSNIDLSDIKEREKAQIAKAKKWVDKMVSGEKPDERYSPIEYRFILDAYKYWGANQMAALGIAPDEKNPFFSQMQQTLFGDGYAMKDFIERVNQGDRDPENETYGVFNAVAQMLTEGKSIKEDERAEQMEDFPMYREIQKLGESRRLVNDEEVAEARSDSYQVTAKEQRDHDNIATMVQNFRSTKGKKKGSLLKRVFKSR